MKAVSALIVALAMAGCAQTQSGYQQFYTPYVDPRTSPLVESLGDNQDPQVFGSDDFKRDIRLLNAKRYVVIGESSFNGAHEDVENAIDQARKVGATLVLTRFEYTDTQTSTSPLFLPNAETTYHSGTVYSGRSSGSYTGTSTAYGSTAVPITTHQRRYDQEAVYLSKLTKRLKFGVRFIDLTSEQRLAIERNTGALADIVMEDGPAFSSNILAGDVVISIDGKSVKNTVHAVQLIDSIPEGASSSTVVVIRKGKEKSIVVELDDASGGVQ